MTTIPTRERDIEAYLRDIVRKAGGICLKLAPTEAGVPDRLVMLPGNRLYLVEVKAPGGALRAIQKAWHAKVARLGVPVAVVASKAECKAWLDDQLSPPLEIQDILHLDNDPTDEPPRA